MEIPGEKSPSLRELRRSGWVTHDFERSFADFGVSRLQVSRHGSGRLFVLHQRRLPATLHGQGGNSGNDGR